MPNQTVATKKISRKYVEKNLDSLLEEFVILPWRKVGEHRLYEDDVSAFLATKGVPTTKAVTFMYLNLLRVSSWLDNETSNYVSVVPTLIIR